jgi:hypothetical protein
MKLLLITMISLSAFAAPINLELLENKTKNYQTVEKLYNEISALIDDNNEKKFCSEVRYIYKELYSILDQDLILIKHLYSFNIDNWTEYGKHLNENARTDFIKFYNYKSKCDLGKQSPLSQFQSGLEGAFINLNFLMMYHQQFILSVSN